MELHPDFKDLLEVFAAEGVEYLVVGGYAVSFHTKPRYTKDVDIWICDAQDNRERTKRALKLFGAPPHVVQALEQAGPEDIVWMGKPPVRVDLLTCIPGATFATAYPNRVKSKWGDTPVSIIGLEDLILAKQAAGRDQDLLDLRLLRKVLSK